MNDTGNVDRQGEYAEEIARRRRRLAAQTLARNFTVQATWIVVLAAGAAIPLSSAVGWDDWVSPALGFVVVVATGIERVFRRTSSGAVATDLLRRRLEREHRLLVASGLEYADAEDDFEIYVERVEAAIAEYDQIMIDYGRRLVERQRG